MLRSRLVVTAGLLLLLAGTAVACGSGSPTNAVAFSSEPASMDSSSTRASTSEPTTTSDPSFVPHFDAPEGSMQYLAKAWNSGDDVSLRHVTTPDGRDELDQMRAFAENLRFDRCEVRADMGDYLCYFDHDDKPGTRSPSVADRPEQLVVVAGPADKQGWYMTVYVSCGA